MSNLIAEDFIFSREQLRQIAIAAKESNEMVTRTFINGIEFTTRIVSGNPHNLEDCECAYNSVVGVEKDPYYVFTQETQDPETVLFHLKLIEDKEELEDNEFEDPYEGWGGMDISDLKVARLEEYYSRNNILTDLEDDD